MLLVGNGPLQDELARTGTDNLHVEILSDTTHEEMASAYSRMDVLVLPSRSTATWTEQFGRVLVEALWCGVPVIGADSGEIPWVVQATGGGVTYPEGDVAALATAIEQMRASRQRRYELARAGRAAVERLFSVDAVASVLSSVLEAAARRDTTRLSQTAAVGQPQT